MLIRCPACGSVEFDAKAARPECSECGAVLDLPEGLALSARRKNRQAPKNVTIDDWTAAALSQDRRVCHICGRRYCVPGAKGWQYAVCPVCWQRAGNDAYRARQAVLAALRESSALRQRAKRAGLHVGNVTEGEIVAALARML